MDEGFAEDYHDKNPFKLNRPLNIFNDNDVQLLRKLVKLLDPTHNSYNNIDVLIKHNGKISICGITLPTFEAEKNLIDVIDNEPFLDSVKNISIFGDSVILCSKERWNLEDKIKSKCHKVTLCEDNPKHAKILEDLKND